MSPHIGFRLLIGLSWLLLTLGGFTGFVFLIIAQWRAMRAQETMARAVQRIAERLEPRPPAP